MLLVLAGLSAPHDFDVETAVVSDVASLVATLADWPVDAVLASDTFADAGALLRLVTERSGWVPALLVAASAPDATALRAWLKRTHDQRLAAQRVETAAANRLAVDTWVGTMRREIAEALHDLKTPVAVVEGYCSNLIDGLDGPLGPEPTKSVERIRLSAGMMKDVIGRVQLVASMPTPIAPEDDDPQSPLGASRTQLDLHELANNVVELFEREAAEHRVSIEVRATKRVPIIWGNAARLNQLLVNLVGNALRVVLPGGQIDVELSPQDGDGTIRVSVSDTGPGIHPALVDTLFDAGVSGSDRKGLGLAIARQIADEHGAQLSADPGGRGDQGASFHLVLPLDPRSRRASALEVLHIDDPTLAGQLLIELSARYGNRLPVGKPEDMEVLASEIVRSSSTIVFAGEIDTRLQHRTMDLEVMDFEEA